MARVRTFCLLIPLICLVLLLSACAVAVTSTPVPPTPTAMPATSTPAPATETPEPRATPMPPSAEALLQAAFDASEQASSYRFSMDMLMTLSGPDISEVEVPILFNGEAQMPDRVRGTMTVTLNGVEVETPIVAIGEMSYVKSPATGQWQASTQDTVPFDPTELTMEASDIEDLELLGEETVDQTPVHHLAGRARLPFSFEEPLEQMEMDALVHYWIGQEDPRLLRVTVEGTMDFTGEVEATTAVSMTIALFDYDVPLEIFAPEVVSATMISVPELAPVAIEATLLAPIESDTAEGHVQRGLVSLADGRVALAAAHFSQALLLRPGWPEALLYRGATLCIDGSVEAAMADLDQAIEAEPDRADAYALRAWASLGGVVREELESDVAVPRAREDIAQALALDPNLTVAAALEELAGVLDALALYDTEPEQALADFESGMSAMEALLEEYPDQVAGIYLSMLPALVQLKAEDRAWLNCGVDAASAQLAENPESYPAYATRGLMNLVLGLQPSPNALTLHQAGNDLLYSIATAHRHMLELDDPLPGPLQVLAIWNVEEAAYSSGSLYVEAFFNQDPSSAPQFAQMLTSYWELQDLFAQIVDDPIIFDVAFSPDGTQLATLSESGPSYLRLWDTVTGEKLHEVELGLDGLVMATTIGHLDYSPDGSRVVAAYTNPVARVIDTQTGEVTLEITHTKPVHSAAFSPDGERIMTVDPDAGAPVVWDAETGARLLTVAVESAVSVAAFSPDGLQIVGAGEQVQVCDAETGALITSLPGSESGFVGAPAISLHGKLMAVPGNPARVYDLITATELYTLTTGARTVAFSPDGRRIATAGFEAVGVWDAESGRLLFLAGHPRGVDSVGFSPDGSRLVTGGSDGRFRVWDAETGAELWNGMAATLWWETAD